MAIAPLALPSLRGSFGDWIYYSCLMPIAEVGTRVSYADEIHPNKALSELIQRSLEGNRAKQIAEYLTAAKERFFNSLVLATYGGHPEWLEVGNFKSATKSALIDTIADGAMDTLGFLSLTGKERIFAVDGQHRVAGIKRALERGQELDTDQVPVLFVGHKKTEAGMQRTRRLFTTLNKTAVPVRKRDIIALDEDDVMAIVARRLVETDPKFRDPKIAVIASANIPASNRTCLMTISNLYDVLKQLFMFESGKRTDRSLRFNRPSDERLEEYYATALNYFTALEAAFKPLRAVLSATNPTSVTEKYRGEFGGHLLFRPIGLDLFTSVSIEYARAHDIRLEQAIKLLKVIPTDLERAPYRHVIWDPIKRVIIPDGKTVLRNVLRYMVGLEEDRTGIEASYKQFVAAHGSGKALPLPSKIV